MISDQLNRRLFLKSTVSLTPIMCLTSLAFANTTLAQSKLPSSTSVKWLPDNDPTAKALGYVVDASKSERPKKGETEGKDQLCNNCQMYTKGEAIGGKESGKCLMLPSGAVHGGGWCKSWVKKA